MMHERPEINPVKIGARSIGPGHPVYIVAELSANHRQNYEEAVHLIHAAKEAGADAVKLQTYTPDTMTIDCDGELFRHGKGSLWEGRSLYELYNIAYMPWEWQPKLKALADDLEIDLFSSAYDRTSVEFLADVLDVPAIKISSFEIIDLPLIRIAAATGKPLIISTGMSTMPEIEEAVSIARESGCRELILLKCTSAYPSPAEEMHLRTIPDLSRAFNLPCGLSDHSRDPAVPVSGAVLGACLIEKHFTISRNNGSADSGFSMEPMEFKEMVRDIRRVEKIVGKVRYRVSASEKDNMKFRRSLYIVRDITIGETITQDHIRSIRPGGGLHPRHLDSVIGMKAKMNIRKGTPLSWDSIEKA